jgi:hypothetical protein
LTIHACVPGLSNPFPEYISINSQFHTGIITNLSVVDIVLSVERAITDNVYYENIRDNCRIARKIFNWQNEEEKLIKIYNEIK